MAPSGLNDAAREVMAAVARWYEDTQGGLATGGSGNAYTLTTNTGFSALADQSVIYFRADRANTGSATLNVDSLGAKTIEAAGEALASGEIVANSIYAVAYNATNDTYDIVNAWVPASIPDSSLSSNVPLLDASNTFTNTLNTLSSANPRLRMTETDAAADNGVWQIEGSQEEFRLRALNDAFTVGTNWLTVARTGTTVDSIDLAATDIQFNGGDLPLSMGGTAASSAAGARNNLGVGTGDSPQFNAINLGNASDTTITRASAGKIEVESRPVLTHDNSSWNSARVFVQSGGSPSGGSNGDIYLIY